MLRQQSIYEQVPTIIDVLVEEYNCFDGGNIRLLAR